MTLAQVASSVSGNVDIWREVAEGLAATLGGILALLGKMVLKKVNGLDQKFDAVLEKFADRNTGWQGTLTNHGLRLDALEQRPERRRKPRP